MSRTTLIRMGLALPLPLSAAELAHERRKAIIGQDLDPSTTFTCDSCPDNRDCKLAFDGYNMGGDLLAEK